MADTGSTPDGDPIDQDAEPTMTAPPQDRPDGGASTGGRADSPDAVDADEAQDGDGEA